MFVCVVVGGGGDHEPPWERKGQKPNERTPSCTFTLGLKRPGRRPVPVVTLMDVSRHLGALCLRQFGTADRFRVGCLGHPDSALVLWARDQAGVEQDCQRGTSLGPGYRPASPKDRLNSSSCPAGWVPIR